MSKIKYSIEDLPNPNVDKRIINYVFFKGDEQELHILSTNPIFENYDPDFLPSMAKIKHKFADNSVSQVVACLILISIGTFFNIFHFTVNTALFIAMIYIYKFQVPKFRKKTALLEKERIEYINEVLTGSEYSIDEFLPKL